MLGKGCATMHQASLHQALLLLCPSCVSTSPWEAPLPLLGSAIVISADRMSLVVPCLTGSTSGCRHLQRMARLIWMSRSHLRAARKPPPFSA